jgi:DNA repair photolyase
MNDEIHITQPQTPKGALSSPTQSPPRADWKQENETKPKEYFDGRGAQVNPANKFLKTSYVQEHWEGIDEDTLLENKRTQYIEVFPKTIVNKVESPDLGEYSMNPYQGCEHGCLYCYARNTHEYWGYSAGMDFEQKILIKKNAPQLLEELFQKPKWEPYPIMFSGNTDCYQPIERKMQITRQMLEVCLKYRHPVGMITKNALILRDLDILTEMAKLRLVNVMVTITSLDEDLRMVMEPRTVTYKNRMKVLKQLSSNGISCGVMMAPIIPHINSYHIPAVIEEAAKNGATKAGYTIVRLNGQIGVIFKDWLFKNFPDRAEKVWHHIEECHGGKVNDSRFGTRMRGEGPIAESIRQLFKLSVKRCMGDPPKFSYDLSIFKRKGDEQLSLF